MSVIRALLALLSPGAAPLGAQGLALPFEERWFVWQGGDTLNHVHVHATQSPQLDEGRGENMTFAGITVELSGKQFLDVEWPMIRGLFVSNRCSPRR